MTEPSKGMPEPSKGIGVLVGYWLVLGVELGILE